MIEHQPLRGIRVIDLARVLAGPFCSMNLADLGAEVIKIEMPEHGDDSRSFAPKLPGSLNSGYFYTVNRGKQSLTLDLHSDEGQQVLLDLARISDIVVENFSPGTMERFNIGYAQLKEINPRIILCSISGFGQTGPMASTPAYDIVAQALGGTMSVTGEAGGAPMRCGVSIGDLAAALYGVIGILSALRVRDRTGVGDHVDIAMLDCQVALLEEAMARYSVSQKVPERIGTRHPSITPFQQFKAADDYFVAGAGNEAIWRRFCDAIGMPELKSDPRFTLNENRTANHADLEPILIKLFATQPRAYWLERLHANGVPSAPIASLDDIAHSPHLSARNMILKADHPDFENLLVPNSPIKSAGSTAAPNTHAPLLGEHNEHVLTGLLGYGREKVTELHRRKII